MQAASLWWGSLQEHILVILKRLVTSLESESLSLFGELADII